MHVYKIRKFENIHVLTHWADRAPRDWSDDLRPSPTMHLYNPEPNPSLSRAGGVWSLRVTG